MLAETYSQRAGSCAYTGCPHQGNWSRLIVRPCVGCSGRVSYCRTQCEELDRPMHRIVCHNRLQSRLLSFCEMASVILKPLGWPDASIKRLNLCFRENLGKDNNGRAILMCPVDPGRTFLAQERCACCYRETEECTNSLGHYTFNYQPWLRISYFLCTACLENKQVLCNYTLHPTLVCREATITWIRFLILCKWEIFGNMPVPDLIDYVLMLVIKCYLISGCLSNNCPLPSRVDYEPLPMPVPLSTPLQWRWVHDYQFAHRNDSFRYISLTK